ncbi:MAG TPA: CHAD domain-containing protein [Parafilimonas sp.]|nr:CHAD domain-containing protein [Parafilimonas sp.]
MLKKEQQYEYIDKRCENATLAVKNFGENKDHEELHKLRVEIKKLKACAAFTSKLAGEHYKKKLRPVSEIFKKAGEIRTARLNLATLKKYRIRATAFRQGQLAIGENVAQQFNTSSGRYTQVIKSTCDELRDDCGDISNKKIREFYSKKIELLSMFFTEKFDEGKLHERRKIIKRLVYVDSLLPDKLKAELAINIPYLDTLQDIIGKWHDALVIIDLLNKAGTGEQKTALLLREKEGLLQAVKLLANHFEKNISIKKTLYTGP